MQVKEVSEAASTVITFTSFTALPRVTIDQFFLAA
jgi:hypothetical protein